MTKKSHRRPARYDNSGCMWGFISILDFRHASKSNRKLLADKRCDVGELLTETESSIIKEPPPPPQGTAMFRDDEDSIGEIVDTNKPSVKTLIEEEMVTEPKLGIKDSDQGHEDLKKKKKKKNRRRSKGNSSFDVENDKHNASGIMEEFCNHIMHERSKSRSVKNPENNNKEKLREVIKEFISQELSSGKHQTEGGGVNFPQELVDVLQIPNLDEESFVNHLGDPSSLLLKYVQSLEDAHLSKQKPKEGVTNKPRRFFSRNVKNHQETNLNPSKDNEENQASTIVILKPGPYDLTCNPSKRNLLESSSDSSQAQAQAQAHAHAQPLQRTNSTFFLAEIKRRWKNVMGKEQPLGALSSSAAIDSEKNLKKGEKSNLGKKSPSKDHFYIEKIARPRKEAEASVGSSNESGNSSKRRVPNIYIEAKRHLSEMLNSGIEEVDSSERRSPKTLARVLSLSEFGSPIPSPRWDRDRSSFLASPMRFPGHREVGKNKKEVGNHVEENRESEEIELGTGPDPEIKPSMSNNEGNTEELRRTEIIEEECSSCTNAATNVLCGGHRSHPLETVEGDNHVEELLKEEVVHHGEESLAPSSPMESPPPSYSRTKTTEENLQVAEDKAFERESPVSVLEPLFMEDEEDISSPRRRTSSSPTPSAHELIRPLQIKFEDAYISSEGKEEEEEEETLATYIRAVLKACGVLNWDELYMKSQSSDQLLEPSLLNEVDFHCNQHATEHDQNLIFDCINEILLQICDRHFGCCPCVSFAGNPRVCSVPDMEGTVSEVWEGVCWHLVRVAPKTLDQVVREDMSRSGSWMDLRLDTETFGLELGDDILDDLIEETVTVSKTTSGFYPMGENDPTREG